MSQTQRQRERRTDGLRTNGRTYQILTFLFIIYSLVLHDFNNMFLNLMLNINFLDLAQRTLTSLSLHRYIGRLKSSKVTIELIKPKLFCFSISIKYF